jgi:hypothetical protein
MFGVSWDRVLAWFVYGLASSWFLWAAFTSARPRSPLDGLTSLLETLAVTPPAWISDSASWMSHPQRAGVVVVLAIGAGLAAMIYARTQSTGSEVACVVLTLAAFQGGGSAMFVISLVTVLIPVGLSALLVLAQVKSKPSAGERPFEHLLGRHTGFVTVSAGLTTLFPFALILLAPLALVVMAIRCLSADRPVNEAAALSYSALHRLHTGSVKDQRAAAPALILAGALLADPHDKQARQDAARSLRDLFTGPPGAVPGPFRPRL